MSTPAKPTTLAPHKLEALPDMLTTVQIAQLLLAFPEGAKVTTATDNASVQAPDGRTVLSAVEVSRNMWRVEAVPGLVIRKESPCR